MPHAMGRGIFAAELYGHRVIGALTVGQSTTFDRQVPGTVRVSGIWRLWHGGCRVLWIVCWCLSYQGVTDHHADVYPRKGCFFVTRFCLV